MNESDPFADRDGDRTIMMPSPGARLASQRAAAPAMRLSAIDDEAPPGLDVGLNPLVAAANPLLNVVSQLRATLSHPDPAGLKEGLIQHIKRFEAHAKAAGVAPEKVIAARYALCTLLDETAASTPWGGSGVWGRHSLLVTFHNEAWGGEKFFRLLGKLAENPAANLDILELMYVCLALGLEGRYRVLDDGRAQLENVRERLAQMLRKHRGEYERDLSGNWRGVTTQKRPLLDAFPLWVSASLVGVILALAYFAFDIALNRKSDPVFAAIQGMRVKSAEPSQAQGAPAARAVPAKPRLAGFLAPEIEAGLVTVVDKDNRSIVTIRGDGLFDPGSALIAGRVRPLLARIAEALNEVPGQVQVTGHTDSQPIASARFPSNWHLSQERASSVARILSATVDSARISSEGRADAEPLVANDTPANRARNRRVEITLLVSGKRI